MLVGFTVAPGICNSDARHSFERGGSGALFSYLIFDMHIVVYLQGKGKHAATPC